MPIISNCVNENYCVSSTGNPSIDDNYITGGTYNSTYYWTGQTNGYFIYYSSGNTQWCLSSLLGGSCLLSGKSPCVSDCPDLCDTYFSIGICPTPTPTPTNNCNVLDFSAIFDCEYTPTPTPTPTVSVTPTITPTPTSTSICSIMEVDACISGYTPTPTPTMTPTPSSTPIITRPCSFSGDVTFNTINDIIICPSSKQFQDCYNGAMYYTTIPLYNPSSGDITQFMVFNATVDGETKCISYVGINNEVSGVNNIVLNSGPYGYANLGECSLCEPTPTPTPTPSSTPII